MIWCKSGNLRNISTSLAKCAVRVPGERLAYPTPDILLSTHYPKASSAVDEVETWQMRALRRNRRPSAQRSYPTDRSRPKGQAPGQCNRCSGPFGVPLMIARINPCSEDLQGLQPGPTERLGSGQSASLAKDRCLWMLSRPGKPFDLNAVHPDKARTSIGRTTRDVPMQRGSFIREGRGLRFWINFKYPARIALDSGRSPRLVERCCCPRRAIPENDARLAFGHVVDDTGLL